MTICEEVLVIGAGPAGIAVSACLNRLGVRHGVLEQAQELAPVWRRHYERLHLHTVGRHSMLPDGLWPKGTPTYPSRQQFIDYLHHYAAAHGVRPRFGVAVERIVAENGGASGGLRVLTADGPITASSVVVATGYNRVPFTPLIPGLDRFTGTLIHSREYRNPAPYAGKRTLVVGCGNSGAEIALDLAEQGVDVSLVVRGPVHVVPRDLLGLPSQSTNLLLARLPLGLRDRIASTVLGLAVGDLSRWGIVRPQRGLNAMIEQEGRIPLLDIGTIAMIRRGRIKVRPGTREVTDSSVVFDDGRAEPYEAIVFATGYRTGLSTLVEGFAAIADARDRPHRFGQATAIPGLYFVGFRNPPTGAIREIAIEAPRVAAAIRAAG